MNDYITKAIEIVKDGGIIIFPTDTAFGMGCRIDNKEAVEKLFSVRKRPPTQATPVLCSSLQMVKEYVADIDQKVEEELMLPYWPGALTIVLPAQVKRVPELVRGGGISIGVRIPNHEIPLAIIGALGVPIIGTSANFHGEPTPYHTAEIDPKLIYLTDYLVPGVTTLKKESTVIDCSDGDWDILRQGAIILQ